MCHAQQESKDNIVMPEGITTADLSAPEDIQETDIEVTADDETTRRYLPLPSHHHYHYMTPIMSTPMTMWGGYLGWDLHEGLNASIGASVFSTFGSGNTWKGAGFGQNLSLMYATPLSSKLTLAVGGYFNNVSWAHDIFHDAGACAVLGYHFNEHWSAYVYGQKSLMNDKHIPRPLMHMSDIGDRIGAAVRYNFNPNFSVQVSFETNQYSNMPMMPPPVRNGNDKR